MTQYIVKVVLNSKNEKVEKVDGTNLKVWISAKPIENKANERLIELLAGFFDLPKSTIRIKSGRKSRRKQVEIAG